LNRTPKGGGIVQSKTQEEGGDQEGKSEKSGGFWRGDKIKKEEYMKSLSKTGGDRGALPATLAPGRGRNKIDPSQGRKKGVVRIYREPQRAARRRKRTYILVGQVKGGDRSITISEEASMTRERKAEGRGVGKKKGGFALKRGGKRSRELTQ